MPIGALCREIGYTLRLPSFLLSAGYASLLEGDYERGAALNEEAAALCRERGYKDSLGYALDNLGWAALLRGDHEHAKPFYKESLTLCVELGNKLIVSESLDGLACVAAAEGDVKGAAKLFGAAEALRETMREAVGYQHSPEEDAWRELYLATARSRLEETAWEEELARGRSMRLEEAVEYALSEQRPPTPVSPTPEHLPASTRAGSLTRRELQTVALVARGLTNRQIAAELSISEHTAATRVRKILKKLGLRSRSQLGSWLAERPPTDPN